MVDASTGHRSEAGRDLPPCGKGGKRATPKMREAGRSFEIYGGRNLKPSPSYSRLQTNSSRKRAHACAELMRLLNYLVAQTNSLGDYISAESRGEELIERRVGGRVCAFLLV